MKNMKVATKLILSFGITCISVIIFAIIVLIFGVLNRKGVNDIDLYLSVQQDLFDIVDNFSYVRVDSRNILYNQDNEVHKSFMARADAINVKIHQITTKIEEHSELSYISSNVSNFKEAIMKYREGVIKVNNANKSKKVLLYELESEVIPAFVINSANSFEVQTNLLRDEVYLDIPILDRERRVSRIEETSDIIITSLNIMSKVVYMLENGNNIQLLQSSVNELLDNNISYLEDFKNSSLLEVNIEAATNTIASLLEFKDLLNKYSEYHIEAIDADKIPLEYGPIIMKNLDYLTSEINHKLDSLTTNVMTLATTSMIVSVIAAIIVLTICLLFGANIIKSVVTTLKNVVFKLNNTSKLIASTSDRLNKGSVSISQDSSMQASSIEETSATMEESAAMITNTADNVKIAAQLSKESLESSRSAGKHVDSLLSYMDSLKSSSDTINSIVSTIDDIARQTNMLAINATVEATRAGGSAGRSFGVVAEEVRNLAQKSAKAVSDTTDIIQDNIKLTKLGYDLSKDVSSSLDSITDKTNKLSDLMLEISTASEEQSRGIKQVNNAISEMEEATQRTAHTADETSVVSQSLQQEIINLEEVVNVANKLIK